MNIKDITRILSNIIPKDVLEYVIVDYANILKNISYHGYIPGKDIFIELASQILPTLYNEYKSIPVFKNNWEINVSAFDDIHCCVRCSYSDLTCIVIIYNYIERKTISHRSFSNNRIVVHLNGDNYIVQISYHEYFQYNIYTQSLTRNYNFNYIANFPDALSIKYIKNFIFCGISDSCYECKILQVCSKKMSNERHVCWLIIDINTASIRQINFNVPKSYGYQCITNKYVTRYDKSNIIFHDYINNKTITRDLKQTKNHAKPFYQHAHNDIFYYFCAGKRIELYDILTNQTLKYLYTIKLKHTNGVIFNNNIIGISNQHRIKIYKITDNIYKRYLNKN